MWQFICIIYYILCNTLVIVSKWFSWVLWVIIKSQNLRRGWWEPLIGNQVGEKLWITWRPITCKGHLKWEVWGTVLWDWAFNWWCWHRLWWMWEFNWIVEYPACVRELVSVEQNLHIWCQKWSVWVLHSTLDLANYSKGIFEQVQYFGSRTFLSSWLMTPRILTVTEVLFRCLQNYFFFPILSSYIVLLSG